MRKILLSLTMLFATNVIADDVQLLAGISDQNGKAHKNVTIMSSHYVHIQNTSGTRKDYKVIWCIGVNNEQDCLRRSITLKNKEHYSTHETSRKMIIDAKGGVHRIFASTSLDSHVGQKEYATLTIS